MYEKGHGEGGDVLVIDSTRARCSAGHVPENRIVLGDARS